MWWWFNQKTAALDKPRNPVCRRHVHSITRMRGNGLKKRVGTICSPCLSWEAGCQLLRLRAEGEPLPKGPPLQSPGLFVVPWCLCFRPLWGTWNGRTGNCGPAQ